MVRDDVRRWGGVSTWAVAVMVGLAGGCGAIGEQPMSTALFMPPASAQPETVDHASTVEQARSTATPDEPGTNPTRAAAAPTPANLEAVQPLAPLTFPRPTTAPAETTAPAMPASAVLTPAPAVEARVATGVYMTVGGVLAQVNETPIYAHTVLGLLDKELQARARDMDAESFRQFARERIVRQTQELIWDEVDYTTAAKALSADDQKLVAQLAMAAEQDRVKESGGSLELAKRRAAEDGYDFDDLCRREYRRIVVGIYTRRQIDPHVQVSAQDMREFYAANSGKIYSDKDRLQFRVIVIDPDRVGGKDPRGAAAKKVAAIREKALAGQDFAALASAENHSESLRASGGDPGGWLDRGSYRVDAVEQALWSLSPGGVTPVIEDEGKFYVAKLVDKHVGSTRPFDDPTVQDDIVRRLTQQQMSAMREQFRQDAMADAMFTGPTDERMAVAVEMVMQKYARWTAGR